MLDLNTRTAILRLRNEGHGARTIAKALSLSRNSVRDVIRDGHQEVPSIERAERLGAMIDEVRSLHATCKGNMIRVIEKLADRGVEVGYSTLTAFCRRHEIGTAPKTLVGQYHFEPGQEMQHDTSPHRVVIGGKERLVQCASLVLAYSTVLYAQVYPRFSRFECRVFLTEAIQHFGGAARHCMVDNTSVIIARGAGKNAEPAAEMVALGKRFRFEFVAHEVGDANRSAHVERRFHYIENNFYPGRSFESLADLNAQLRHWCSIANAKPRRRLPRTPIEMLAVEATALSPLPLHIPEIYELHRRRVDTEGTVSLHRNRYPVAALFVGRSVDVHETADDVRIFDGHKVVAEYGKRAFGAGERVPVPPEMQRRGMPRKKLPLSPEESVLRAIDPAFATLVDAFKKRDGGRALKAVRKLHRMFLDYPTDALVAVVCEVEAYELLDLTRIERLVLKRLAGEFFRLPTDEPEKPT